MHLSSKNILDNKELIGKITGLFVLIGTMAFGVFKKIWPSKSKPSVSQATEGDQSPIISNTKGPVLAFRSTVKQAFIQTTKPVRKRAKNNFFVSGPPFPQRLVAS